mgnify:CR=1 FL=1
MDKIILNINEKESGFTKRIVLEVKMTLQNCDFLTIGSDIIFDKDTDFFTFGIDVTGGDRQLAIVTGEFLIMPAKELIENIKESLKDKFEIMGEDDVQLWMREK